MLNLVNVSAGALFSVDSETLTMMWQTVLLGMGMVFAVLALLWIILSLFGVFFGGKKKEPKAEKIQKTEQTAVAVETVEAVPAAADDAELIAVITAAVAAYRASEEGISADDGSFRVVSFKRVRTSRAWNAR